MQVRTFQAAEMREALGQVKKEMGPDAVILSTRRVRKGLVGPARIEITAAYDAPAALPAGAAPADATLAEAVAPLRREIRAVRELVRDLCDAGLAPSPSSPTPSPARRALEAGDVDAALAEEIVRAAGAEAAAGAGAAESAAHASVRDAVASRLWIAPPVGEGTPLGRVAALVGPTGVGKTTTLAKIAAHAALDRRMNVALVTLDMYRAAATEQLRAYADLIGVPVEIAADPRGFAQACARHPDADLILCDTAGGRHDGGSIDRLAACLGAVPAVETWLVLAAATRRADLSDLVRRFAPLGPARLVVTKLDETRLWGGVLNAVAFADLPLLCVTTGRRVPEDIAAPDAQAIARRILAAEDN